MKTRDFVRFMAFLLVLVVAIGAGWSAFTPTIGNGSDQTSTITWIIDGDTFVLQGRERIRLLGIDAPETKGSSKLDALVKDEGRDRDSIFALGETALRFCIRHYKGKTVRLERDGIQPDRDVYGRLLRYIYLEDGTCVNEELLRKGQALVYRRADFDKRVAFLAAEEEARRAHKGVWAK